MTIENKITALLVALDITIHGLNTQIKSIELMHQKRRKSPEAENAMSYDAVMQARESADAMLKTMASYVNLVQTLDILRLEINKGMFPGGAGVIEYIEKVTVELKHFLLNVEQDEIGKTLYVPGQAIYASCKTSSVNGSNFKNLVDALMVIVRDIAARKEAGMPTQPMSNEGNELLQLADYYSTALNSAQTELTHQLDHAQQRLNQAASRNLGTEEGRALLNKQSIVVDAHNDAMRSIIGLKVDLGSTPVVRLVEAFNDGHGIKLKEAVEKLQDLVAAMSPTVRSVTKTFRGQGPDQNVPPDVQYVGEMINAFNHVLARVEELNKPAMPAPGAVATSVPSEVAEDDRREPVFDELVCCAAFSTRLNKSIRVLKKIHRRINNVIDSFTSAARIALPSTQDDIRASISVLRQAQSKITGAHVSMTTLQAALRRLTTEEKATPKDIALLVASNIGETADSAARSLFASIDLDGLSRAGAFKGVFFDAAEEKSNRAVLEEVMSPLFQARADLVEWILRSTPAEREQQPEAVEILEAPEPETKVYTIETLDAVLSMFAQTLAMLGTLNMTYPATESLSSHCDDVFNALNFGRLVRQAVAHNQANSGHFVKDSMLEKMVHVYADNLPRLAHGFRESTYMNRRPVMPTPMSDLQMMYSSQRVWKSTEVEAIRQGLCAASDFLLQQLSQKGE